MQRSIRIRPTSTSTSLRSPTAGASTSSRRPPRNTRRTRRSTAIDDRSTVALTRAMWPSPADFDDPPDASRITGWLEADRAARPARLARLRDRFDGALIDAYFGVRREHMRYLTGFALADGEEKVAGTSGQFLIGG